VRILGIVAAVSPWPSGWDWRRRPVTAWHGPTPPVAIRRPGRSATRIQRPARGTRPDRESLRRLVTMPIGADPRRRRVAPTAQRQLPPIPTRPTAPGTARPRRLGNRPSGSLRPPAPRARQERMTRQAPERAPRRPKRSRVQLRPNNPQRPTPRPRARLRRRARPTPRTQRARPPLTPHPTSRRSHRRAVRRDRHRLSPTPSPRNRPVRCTPCPA
jgi:hypothetical protein